MKKSLNNQEIKRFIFYSEEPYIVHIGEHYEDVILHAKEALKEVITVRNVNECTSSIPLERALNLLEKYYKLTKRTPKSIQEDKTASPVVKNEPLEEKIQTKSSKKVVADPY